MTTPVNTVLYCPICGKLHIDTPDPFAVELWDVPIDGLCHPDDAEAQLAIMVEHDAKRWTNPPHTTHLCRIDQGGCGTTWKPFDYPTNGVCVQ
jgi:hypothetical protein